MVFFDICFNIRLFLFLMFFISSSRATCHASSKCVIGQGLRDSEEIEESWIAILLPSTSTVCQSLQWEVAIIDKTLSSHHSYIKIVMAFATDSCCGNLKTWRRHWEERRKCIDSFRASVKYVRSAIEVWNVLTMVIWDKSRNISSDVNRKITFIHVI